MKPALNDFHLPAVAFALEAVLAGDPPRPPALEVAFQRFGLADPLKRRAPDFLDEKIYFFKNVPVGLLPEEVVVPGEISP